MAWNNGVEHTVSTHDLGVDPNGRLVYMRRRSDSARHMAAGLLPTLFEWYRVVKLGRWTCGPYVMRYWDFCQTIAPVPWNNELHGGDARYVQCPHTGFVRTTPTAMVDFLRRYGMDEQVMQRLNKT